MLRNRFSLQLNAFESIRHGLECMVNVIMLQKVLYAEVYSIVEWSLLLFVCSFAVPPGHTVLDETAGHEKRDLLGLRIGLELAYC